MSGDSEKKLRELFDQAADNAPCVLFIDEIDCITQKRENAGKEMERRIVAQLLSCLDDLNSRPDCQVVVIGEIGLNLQEVLVFEVFIFPFQSSQY